MTNLKKIKKMIIFCNIGGHEFDTCRPCLEYIEKTNLLNFDLKI